jgi:hypothetical protein
MASGRFPGDHADDGEHAALVLGGTLSNIHDNSCLLYISLKKK